MATLIMQKTLTENVLRELHARGWTRSDLAEKCGFAPARITELLQGRSDPRLGTVEKIATALGVPVSHLLTPLTVAT